MRPTANRDREREARARLDMMRSAVAERAALYYRLGFSQQEARRRLGRYLDWDFEIGSGGRPSALSDTAISELVAATYARRPLG